MSEEIRPKDIEWEEDLTWVNPKKNLFCDDLDCVICNAFKLIKRGKG